MQDKELFQRILGLESPWSVAEVKLDIENQQVNIHVTDPAERAAIAKSFRKDLRRAGLADLVHDADPDSSDTDEIPPPTLLDVVRRSFRAADAPHA